MGVFFKVINRNIKTPQGKVREGKVPVRENWPRDFTKTKNGLESTAIYSEGRFATKAMLLLLVTYFQLH